MLGEHRGRVCGWAIRGRGLETVGFIPHRNSLLEAHGPNSGIRDQGYLTEMRTSKAHHRGKETVAHYIVLGLIVELAPEHF